jgi:hypothetical protein
VCATSARGCTTRHRTARQRSGTEHRNAHEEQRQHDEQARRQAATSNVVNAPPVSDNPRPAATVVTPPAQSRRRSAARGRPARPAQPHASSSFDVQPESGRPFEGHGGTKVSKRRFCFVSSCLRGNSRLRTWAGQATNPARIRAATRDRRSTPAARP